MTYDCNLDVSCLCPKCTRNRGLQKTHEKAMKEAIRWAQAVLTALNVGDVASGSPIHKKLREVMISYRKSLPCTCRGPEDICSGCMARSTTAEVETPPPVALVLVIALSHREFDQHAQMLAVAAKFATRSPGRWIIDDKEYRFVVGVDHIRGLDDFEVEYWGNWQRRPDLDDIRREIQVRLLVRGGAK